VVAGWQRVVLPRWERTVVRSPNWLSPELKIGKPVDLFSIGTEARAALHSQIGFDVSPDGQRFLVPIITSSEKSEIVVIQNWEIALRGSSRDLKQF
jgi:hypothetical protein